MVWTCILPLNMWCQNLPQACGGSKVRYTVDEVPGSVFEWEITGGTLLKNDNNSADIRWDNEAGIHVITVTQYNSIGCRANPVHGYVMVGAPELHMEGNTTICEGESTTIKATAGYKSIKWNTGSNDSVIVVRNEGYYAAKATFSGGCTAEDSIYLAVNPKPQFSLGRDTSICSSDQITLDPKIVASTYQWSTGETSPSIQLSAVPQTVWLKVTNNFGCSSVDSIQIKPCAENQLKRFIPNAFTPNNDNDNDTWRIDVLAGHPEAGVSIYNRWGQLVYKADNYYSSRGWDGTSNGRPLPMDTYFYVIDLKDGSRPIMGSISLIR